jgi:hypothetical protein
MRKPMRRVTTSSAHRSPNRRRISDSKRKRSMHQHHVRQFGDSATRTARDTIQTAEAGQDTNRAVERQYFAAAEAARDFSMMLIETAQSNTVAAINFAWEVATARHPTQAAAVWYYHSHKNFETLMEQSRQLMALAQRLMTFAEPLSHSIRQAPQRTSFNRPFLRLVTS